MSLSHLLYFRAGLYLNLAVDKANQSRKRSPLPLPLPLVGQRSLALCIFCHNIHGNFAQ